MKRRELKILVAGSKARAREESWNPGGRCRRIFQFVHRARTAPAFKLRPTRDDKPFLPTIAAPSMGNIGRKSALGDVPLQMWSFYSTKCTAQLTVAVPRSSKRQLPTRERRAHISVSTFGMVTKIPIRKGITTRAKLVPIDMLPLQVDMN